MIFSSTVFIVVVTCVGVLLWLGLWGSMKRAALWALRLPGRLISAAENWVFERQLRRAELRKIEAEAKKAEEALINEQLAKEPWRTKL